MTPADDALTSLDTVGPPTSLVTVGPPLVKESQGILHEASGIRHCRWTVTVAFMISFAFMITCTYSQRTQHVRILTVSCVKGYNCPAVAYTGLQHSVFISFVTTDSRRELHREVRGARYLIGD